MSRTYLDFCLGFGFLLSVYLFVQACVLWQLAAMARQHAVLVRPLIATFFVAQVAGALLAWKFIFPLPAAFCLLIAVGIGLSLYSVRQDGHTQT